MINCYFFFDGQCFGVVAAVSCSNYTTSGGRVDGIGLIMGSLVIQDS